LEELGNEMIPEEICWNNCCPSEERSNVCIVRSLYKRWERRITRGNEGVNYYFLSLSYTINTYFSLFSVTSAACNHITVLLPPFRSRTCVPW